MKNLERCELVELGNLLIDELGIHRVDEPGINDRQWMLACVVKFADTGDYVSRIDMDSDIKRYSYLIMDLSL